MYKVNSNITPDKMTNLSSIANRHNNLRNSNRFVLSRYNVDIGRNSLRCIGPLAWEQTPTLNSPTPSSSRHLRTFWKNVIMRTLFMIFALWRKHAWLLIRIKALNIFSIAILIQYDIVYLVDSFSRTPFFLVQDVKVTVYLQGCLASKQYNATSLSCRYLNSYIKLKLTELAK